jgi:energy-coupling factor transporter ATP-binding protein EcfA2
MLLGIGCLETSWDDIRLSAGLQSFAQRVTTHLLPALTGDRAVTLLEKRLASWSDADPKRGNGWPFDLASVKQFVDHARQSPRSFVQVECQPRFAQWLAGKRQDWIRMVDTPLPPAPVEVLFQAEWQKELEAVKAANKSAVDTSELELWAGVSEAFAIAKMGGYSTAGYRIEAIETNPPPIIPSGSDKRPSLRLKFAHAAGSATVLVAVSKKDSGVAFGAWQAALEQAMKASGGRAVVIWHRSELGVGKTAKAYRNYTQLVNDGKLRAFSLDVEEATFHQLETLRRILISARTGNLLLGKEAVNETVCRELVVKAGLFANLKLFEFVFQGWPGLTPATVTPPLVPPVAPSPPAPPRAVAPSPPTVASQSVPTSTPPPVAPTPSPAVPPSAPPLPEWVEVMLRKTAEYLKKKGQPVQPAGAMLGPTFVRLKMEPRGDTDFSKVRRQAENLKVHLVLEQNPLILSQPGHYSIDVQRTDRQSVSLPPLLLTCPPKFAGEPAFPVGVGVAGNVEWLNLSDSEACHLLVAGTTGSGKSEFLKSMLAGLAARLEPGQLKFRLIDPKRVTFNVAANCPYLGGPVVNDGDEALEALRECAEEMERRYLLLQQRGVDHIRHLKGPDAVARWVVVMDEFADLMVDKATKKQLEPLLKRLGAKARAAGIHLILGTQRPDASVVTPVLRANLPGKIGLQVGSERESKLFLDEPDAAYLFGKGDLVWKRGGGLVRLQSPFVPKEEFDRYLRVI